MLSELIRHGILGAGHGLFFAKRHKMAIKFFRAGLKGADEWEVPLVMAHLGVSLFYVGELSESRKCFELVICDAGVNPESWDDDYSLEILERTNVYLDKLKI